MGSSTDCSRCVQPRVVEVVEIGLSQVAGVTRAGMHLSGCCCAKNVDWTRPAIDWSWGLFVTWSRYGSASTVGEGSSQVLQGLGLSVKGLHCACEYHMGSATYQQLVFVVPAVYVLNWEYAAKYHFDVPTPVGCREHCILRNERTSVICLLLH